MATGVQVGREASEAMAAVGTVKMDVTGVRDDVTAVKHDVSEVILQLYDCKIVSISYNCITVHLCNFCTTI